MAGPEKIGEARIDITADADGVKKGTQAAKKEVESLGDTADKTGSRVGGAFEKAGSRIEKSTSGVRKFTDALSSVTGIATGLIGVFGLVAGAVVGLKSALEKLNGTGPGDKNAPLPNATELLGKMADEARGVSDALANSPGFVKLQEDIRETEKLLKKLEITPTFEGSAAKTAEREKEVREELLNLRRQESDFLRRNRREQEKAAAAEERKKNIADGHVQVYRKLQEEAAKFTDQLEQQNQIDDIGFMPEREQIAATADFLEEQLREAAKALGLDVDDEAVQKRLEIIRKEEQLKNQALDDRIAKEDAAVLRQEQIRDDRQRQRVDDLRRGIDGIFGAEFSTLMNNLTGATRDAANALGRLKR